MEEPPYLKPKQYIIYGILFAGVCVSMYRLAGCAGLPVKENLLEQTVSETSLPLTRILLPK